MVNNNKTLGRRQSRIYSESSSSDDEKPAIVLHRIIKDLDRDCNEIMEPEKSVIPSIVVDPVQSTSGLPQLQKSGSGITLVDIKKKT